jgi:alcohol dehydrogenase
MARTMRANVFRDTMQFGIEKVPVPTPGPGEALIRITLTTICGTDVHIVKGEYPVRSGLIIGHEPVGVIEALGAGVTGYEIGDRVLVGAVTPCGQCRACLSAQWRSAGTEQATKRWAAGDSATPSTACKPSTQLCPTPRRTSRKIPDDLTDEQVVLLQTSPPQGSAARNRRKCGLATRSPCSRWVDWLVRGDWRTVNGRGAGYRRGA